MSTPHEPPSTPPLPVASILDYRTSRPVESIPGSRARGIGKGIGLVWALLGIFIGLLFLSQGNGGLAFAALVLGGVLCITLAAFDVSKKGHAGLFIGLFLGVLTVIGVAALALTIICGNLWR